MTDKERIEYMLGLLRNIQRRGEDCWRDCGYPGSCGCGRAMADMAADARCLRPGEYGACGICAECALDLSKKKGGE
jgi:hypothetical protein